MIQNHRIKCTYLEAQNYSWCACQDFSSQTKLGDTMTPLCSILLHFSTYPFQQDSYNNFLRERSGKVSACQKRREIIAIRLCCLPHMIRLYTDLNLLTIHCSLLTNPLPFCFRYWTFRASILHLRPLFYAIFLLSFLFLFLLIFLPLSPLLAYLTLSYFLCVSNIRVAQLSLMLSNEQQIIPRNF